MEDEIPVNEFGNGVGKCVMPDYVESRVAPRKFLDKCYRWEFAEEFT